MSGLLRVPRLGKPQLLWASTRRTVDLDTEVQSGEDFECSNAGRVKLGPECEE